MRDPFLDPEQVVREDFSGPEGPEFARAIGRRIKRRTFLYPLFFATLIAAAAVATATGIVLLAAPSIGDSTRRVLGLLMLETGLAATGSTVLLYRTSRRSYRLNEQDDFMPVTSFLLDWREFETTARRTAGEMQGRDPTNVPLSLIASTFRERGVWDDDAINEFRYLVTLRNQIVHGLRNPTWDEISLARAYTSDLHHRLEDAVGTGRTGR